jgi:RNA polymerase sigma factor (sigma-70 family)
MQDAELLREYVRNGSETAFAELVKRYVDLVYCSARRQLGDAQLAEEVAQNVFCLLARKAGTLRGEPVLAGWLYWATRFIAARTQRAERRRRRREQEAVQMNQPDLRAEEMWGQLEPMLEEALDQLGEQDRLAVLLRFFQRKSLAEVGATLRISEAAAKMRVGRAIERMREFFAKRGVACSAAGLTALLAERSVEAVPAAIVSEITAAILVKQAATATWPFVQTLLFMTRIKKTLWVAGGLVAVVMSVAVIHFSQPSNERTGSLVNSGAKATPVGDPMGMRRETNRRVPRRGGPPVAIDLATAIANLRDALHRPRSEYGVKQYPSEDVMWAILAFGPQRQAAFAVLKEAVADPDAEVRQLAVSAMGLVGSPARPQTGLVGEPASEAAPFLWNILLGDDRELGALALSSLRSIGFQSEDIPRLADLLIRSSGGSITLDGWRQQNGDQMLRRYIPGAVADLLQRNPDAAAYAGKFESLLDDSRPEVRFEAACALARYEAGSNPKIFFELTAGLQSGDNLMPLMALETLQTLGPAAEPMMPAVSNYANASVDLMREIAFRTLGRIDNNLRYTLPEVDQALKEDESLAAWNQQAMGRRSYDDLLAALKDPRLAPAAAKELGAMGPSAAAALPDLLAALAGQDEASRDRIVEAIQGIDPNVTISKVNAKTIADAALAAHLTLMEEANTNTALAELLRQATSRTSRWCTRQELTNLVDQLAALDAETCRRFVAKAVELDPSLKDVLPPAASR